MTPTPQLRYRWVAGLGVAGATGAMALVSVILGMGPSDSAIAGAVFATAGSVAAVVAYLRRQIKRGQDSGSAEEKVIAPRAALPEPPAGVQDDADDLGDRRLERNGLFGWRPAW